MALQDRVMEETKERKNAVEEYVYSMRSKVADALAEFAEPAVRSSSSSSTPRKTGCTRTARTRPRVCTSPSSRSSRRWAIPSRIRAAEESKRGPAAAALTATVVNTFAAMAAPDADHAHIDAADLEKIAAECKAAADWLAEKTALQAGLAKTAEPVLLSADVAKKEEALKRFAHPHPGAAQARAQG